MNKKIIIGNKSIYLIPLIFGIFFIFNNVFAANLSDAFGSMLSNFGSNAGYDNSVTGPENMIATVIKAALSLIGVLFFVLMLYGGYLWMTAAGSDERLKRAQNIITAAVTGLVIVVAAYAISSFVMRALESGALK